MKKPAFALLLALFVSVMLVIPSFAGESDRPVPGSAADLGPPSESADVLAWDSISWRVVDAESRSDCKDDGWRGYGFSSQGQCLRFVNTGQDSR